MISVGHRIASRLGFSVVGTGAASPQLRREAASALRAGQWAIVYECSSL